MTRFCLELNWHEIALTIEKWFMKLPEVSEERFDENETAGIVRIIAFSVLVLTYIGANIYVAIDTFM